MEYIFDSDWNQLTEPDWALGYAEQKTLTLGASYVTETEGEGHYETVKEYPNGGKDVEWVWDTTPVGAWHFTRDGDEWADCPVPPEKWWSKEQTYEQPFGYRLYTPYTEEELQERAEQEAAALAQAEEAQAQAEMVQALPDAVAELSELAADNTTNVEDIADALAELSALVSDLLGEQNG